MKIKFAWIAIAAALFLLPQTAHAQQPSAAALATAKQILELKHANQLYAPLITNVIGSIKNDFIRSNLNLQKDLNEVGDQLLKASAPREAEINNDFARNYASAFTEQELKDMLAFYSSPLGRKMIETEPAVLDKSMQQLDNWTKAFAQEVTKTFVTEMKKRGHDL